MADRQRPPRATYDNYAIAAGPRLGVRGWLRWMWRQVTSMRVALILLLLLALAAIPGSVLPQWPQDPSATRAYLEQYPTVGPLLDSWGFLDVFGSAWFTAIYLLLFASLVGCIVPRTVAHARALRAPISATPRSLERYVDRTEVEVDDATQALERVRAWVRPQPRWWGAITGYRVRLDERTVKGQRQWALAADKGHVREIGNLIFHVALVGILVSMAFGSLLTHRGQALIIEGRSFTNAVAAYDSFESGGLFSPDSLLPFTLRVNSFESQFDAAGRASFFRANVTLTEPGLTPRTDMIEVNRPLQVDGGKIYLQGNGYAPNLTVTDSAGNVAHDGPVPFLPQDEAYTSEGVVKVPDVTTGEQFGLEGTLLPSAVIDGDDAYSIHPDPTNPVIFFRVYMGDLGLDTGVPQNAYQLDKAQLSPVQDEQGEPQWLAMRPGDTVDLPDGLGTVTWESMPRFVALDLRADPTLPWLLGFAIASLLGLSMSLFGSQRRLWVIAPVTDGPTVVEAAAYGPAHDTTLDDRLRAMVAAATEQEHT
jgi:cytochrome c biogenesis protein